jgi:hypothetical protein
MGISVRYQSRYQEFKIRKSFCGVFGLSDNAVHIGRILIDGLGEGLAYLLVVRAYREYRITNRCDLRWQTIVPLHEVYQDVLDYAPLSARLSRGWNKSLSGRPAPFHLGPRSKYVSILMIRMTFE